MASARQPLPLLRGVLVIEGVLIWLANELSGLGGPLSFFGFLISRVLRFCPLAMAECPFDEVCTVPRTGADRFKTVLRRYPLMTLVVAADAVLQVLSRRRERSSNMVYPSG